MVKYSGSVEAALNTRNANISRSQDAQAKYYSVTAEIDVFGPGDAIIDVTFPVYFVDKPKHFKGAELQSGQGFELGSLPTHNIAILQWDIRVRDDGTSVYSGATLGIVTSGPAGLLSTVQFHAEGIGIRQTTSSASAVDDQPGVSIPDIVTPGPPIIGVPSVSGRTVTISFMPTTTGGSPITLFTATAESSDGGTTFVVTAPSSPIIFTLLDASKTYEIVVQGTNSEGTGAPSASTSPFVTGP